MREGLAPDIEVRGTEAWLAVDRIKSTLSLARPNGEVSVVETVADPGFGNRFSKHVFPALRQWISGIRPQAPNMEDGYHVQLFTDAAAQSARTGTWIRMEDVAK